MGATTRSQTQSGSRSLTSSAYSSVSGSGASASPDSSRAGTSPSMTATMAATSASASLAPLSASTSPAGGNATVASGEGQPLSQFSLIAYSSVAATLLFLALLMCLFVFFLRRRRTAQARLKALPTLANAEETPAPATAAAASSAGTSSAPLSAAGVAEDFVNVVAPASLGSVDGGTADLFDEVLPIPTPGRRDALPAHLPPVAPSQSCASGPMVPETASRVGASSGPRFRRLSSVVPVSSVGGGGSGASCLPSPGGALSVPISAGFSLVGARQEGENAAAVAAGQPSSPPPQAQQWQQHLHRSSSVAAPAAEPAPAIPARARCASLPSTCDLPYSTTSHAIYSPAATPKGFPGTADAVMQGYRRSSLSNVVSSLLSEQQRRQSAASPWTGSLPGALARHQAPPSLKEAWVGATSCAPEADALESQVEYQRRQSWYQPPLQPSAAPTSSPSWGGLARPTVTAATVLQVDSKARRNSSSALAAAAGASIYCAPQQLQVSAAHAVNASGNPSVRGRTKASAH